MTLAFNSMSAFLFITLFTTIVICAIYIGRRLGQNKTKVHHEPEKAHIASIQGCVLGLVSFLLAFTFSIAIHHFDDRNLAMMQEANAIGTAWLRAKNLPEPIRNQTLTTYKQYINVRVKEEEIPLNQISERKILLDEASRLRSELWQLSSQAIGLDDRVTTTGLYLQALNQMIDAWGLREEVLNRSIPNTVVSLLVCLVVFSAALIGYTSTINLHPPSKASALFLVAIVVLTYVLIDIDTPRRGIIRINHKNMLELQIDINSQ